MKKALALLLIFLLSSSAFCFAEKAATFEQRTLNQVVDLNTNKLRKHGNRPSTYSQDEPSSNLSTNEWTYFDKQILCVLSMFGDGDKGNSSIAADVKVTVELVSGQWCYVYNGTDTRYMRPFGIQLIAKSKNGSSYNASTQSIQFLGNNGEYNLYLGERESTTTKKSVTVPASVLNNVNSVWWDVVLVLEDDINPTTDTITSSGTGITYNLLRSNSYYTAVVKFTIESGSTKLVQEVFLKGYYSDDLSPAEEGCNLMVTRLAAASDIDIKAKFGSTTKTDVATYNFSSGTTYSSSSTRPNPGTMKIILSSSNNVLVQSSEFALRHTSPNGTYDVAGDTNHNTVKFLAYVTSDDYKTGHKNGETSNPIIEFDGTGYVTSIKGGSVTGNCLVIEPTIYKYQGGGYNYLWANTGTISIIIPENQNVNG
ncbi:MAG: hypothetical protein HUK23_07030, partial [Sphaerochaetaceae bacterium]|nr:hypothetical protein [Sphaerochaetaceae bacterium]